MSIVVQEQDDLITLKLDSSFDVSQYEEFKSICEKYKAPENCFNLDFSKTHYMDSSALGMLLLLREQTMGNKRKVKLINVSGTVLKILEVAQFKKLFTIN
ncbi:STAS domain-containing protein [Thiomicrorhabdus sp. Milos-T2]|uniref:STAS domain-containing protein n=1 Tax=Thiomicrorhabdus sp. Milos-T2 TaxID=90814 RepID=UPI000493D9ED|nr:STAS domain-containing protein [Thiomicrorhabdus sp. Milos-T2]